MNFFRRILFKTAVSLAKISFMPQWVRYAFTKMSMSKLISEGYKANSAVSACATTLQLTFPEPPLLAGYEEDGRFIPDYKHPVTSLLQQPNPDMGLAEFLQFAITYAPIGGNTYFWKQRLVNGRVKYLWPFSDLQITPIAGHDTSDGFVSAYEYDSGDGQIITIPKEDIIHWKWMIDPQNPWRGIGAIELCAREVDRDNEATSYIFALLKNNAVPPVVITMAEGDTDTTQDELDAMGLKWVQKHGAGQPAFIGYGQTVQQMGFDLQKLAGDTLADIPETRIAANFHVPPSVAGLNVGVKRSDYGDTAARKAFTEQTLMALWRSLASELRNGLKDEFPGTPDNFMLQFDIRNVGALQEQKKDQWERVTLAFDRSGITRKEMKEMLGIVPMPGDDVYKVSLATEFIPANQETVVREPGKALTTKGTKEHEGKERQEKAHAAGKQLQSIRATEAKRMETAVDVYFAQLSQRVTERTKKRKTKNVKSDLPSAEELLTSGDEAELTKLVKRFYAEIIQLSWNAWNVSLGVETAFDLTDPMITEILAGAGMRVKDIQATTLDEIRSALQYGNEHGWSIDDLVRGDAEAGISGLRDIVQETYAGRARNIARTELGDAQNAATVQRYEQAGVDRVEILDNGNTDDDEECQVANGQIWTLAYFNDHRLEHPNCTRAAAPYFGNQEPDRG